MNQDNYFTRWLNIFRVQSIGKRVILGFVLMSLLTALSISLGSAVVNYFNTRQQALERLESVISLREIELRNWNDSLQNELLFTLNDTYSFEQIPVVLDLAHTQQYYDWYNQAVRNRLISLTSQSKLIREYCLVDLQGQVVLCTDQDWAGKDCKAQKFFETGLRAPYSELPAAASQVSSSCWVVTNAVHQAYVLVSRPVINYSKQVVGVLVGRASSGNLAAILSNPTGLGRTGHAYLLSAQLGVLSPDPLVKDRLSVLPNQQLTADTQPFGYPVASSQVTSGIFRGLSGQQVVSAGIWLPNLDYSLVIEQDLSDAFQSILVNLFVSLGIGLAAAMVTIITSIFISRAIIRPIDELAGIATEIAGGNLNRSAPIAGKDEIAVLAQAFNSMTAQLKDFILNLEERVQERTQALLSSNRELKQRALQLETVAAVSRMITAVQDLRELLPEVVTYIGGTFHYSDVRVYLLEKDTLLLKAYSQTVKPVIQTIPLEMTSLNSEVVKTRKSILVGDQSKDARVLEDVSLQAVFSELTVPLQVGKRVVGTLDVCREGANSFSSEDVLLIQSLGDQIAVAVENEHLYNRTLELAVHEERSRLARDLHDSVVQSLYSLNLMMGGWLEHIRSGDSSNMISNLERASEIIHQVLKEMRLMVYQLNPRVLEWEGLGTALRHRLESVESRAGIKSYLAIPPNLSLSPGIGEGLYHIAQEALNNALKHSSESEVQITISLATNEHAGEAVVLEIRDNGQGFIFETVDRSGMGLANMKHRAEEYHGILSIVSSPGKGTTIRVEIPLPSESLV